MNVYIYIYIYMRVCAYSSLSHEQESTEDQFLAGLNRFLIQSFPSPSLVATPILTSAILFIHCRRVLDS